jgi:hypothetical protein
MEFASQVIGHKVDIYGSDACLMGMAEVANEMSDYVDYFVGSQELEPGSGWPYGDFLAHWEKAKDPSAEKIAKILVKTHIKSYQDGSNGDAEVTFSAFDLRKLAALNSAIAQFGNDMRQLNPEERAKVLDVARKVQTFGYMDYADLLDFTAKLKLMNVKGISAQDIANIESAAQEVIIANGVTEKYDQAHGMSIWLPLNYQAYTKRSDRYRHLEFSLNTQWSDTLENLLQGVSPDDGVH